MATKYNPAEASLSIDPMSRLKLADTNRFIVNNASHPQYLSRYHGGHRRDNHPYISGYWYFLINPPARLFGGLGSNTLEKARDWMFTTAESFTPPSRTLTKVDVPGMGGMSSSYVGGQEITRTFSVNFREYQELPIFNILQTWTSMLDPNTGVSPLAGDEYIPANYKGSAFVALCKPTIGNREKEDGSSTQIAREDIEQIFYFDGVYPEGSPYDSLTSDISTNEGLSISVSFSFDGFPLLKDSANVITEFLKLTNDLMISDTYEHYRSGIDKATDADSRADNNIIGTSGTGVGTV